MYENVRYRKPFLKEAIARIDFVAPVDGLEKSMPQKLAKVASEQFPIVEPNEGVRLEVEKSGDHRSAPYRQWNFFGKEREKQLSISPHFMFISFKSYDSYAVFMDNWSAVVNALGKAFPDAGVRRFGLRYINNIEIEGLAPTAWGRLHRG